MPRPIVDDCCGLIDTLATPIARLEREIGKLAKPDPRVEALLALPGIGRLTAMTLLAEIGERCATCDRKVRHGHITKQGSVWVGWILQEAAQRAKTQPPFAHTYAQIAHRRGRQIATVAISRRLLARCFHILTDLEVTTEEVTTGRARITA